ncbi:hypothetical protein QUF80_16130 [Desulfococcaceae bacterium HSG8]|nr:hypothetical protein [Desulfococcaceae bacterium HSG8]
MEPISMIMGALGAAAGIAAEGTIQEAAKDGYNKLKELIMGRFRGNPEGEMALTKYEEKPAVWAEPLKDALATTEADKDQTIIRAAEELLDKIKDLPGGDQRIQSITKTYGDYSAASGAYGTSTVNVNRKFNAEAEKIQGIVQTDKIDKLTQNFGKS